MSRAPRDMGRSPSATFRRGRRSAAKPSRSPESGLGALRPLPLLYGPSSYMRSATFRSGGFKSQSRSSLWASANAPGAIQNSQGLGPSFEIGLPTPDHGRDVGRAFRSLPSAGAEVCSSPWPRVLPLLLLLLFDCIHYYDNYHHYYFWIII